MGKLNFCKKCGSMQVEEAKAQLEELLNKKTIVATNCGLCDKNISIATDIEKNVEVVKIKEEPQTQSEVKSKDVSDGKMSLRTKRKLSSVVSSPDYIRDLDVVITRGKEPVSKVTGGGDPVSEAQSDQMVHSKKGLKTKKRSLGKHDKILDLNVDGEGDVEMLDIPFESDISGDTVDKTAKRGVAGDGQRKLRTRKSSVVSKRGETSTLDGADGDDDVEMIDIPFDNEDSGGKIRVNDDDVSSDGDDFADDGGNFEPDSDFEPDNDNEPDIDNESDNDKRQNGERKGKKRKAKEDKIDMGVGERKVKKRKAKERKGGKGIVIKSLLAPDVLDLLTDESKQEDPGFAQCKFCQLSFYRMQSFTAHIASKHKQVKMMAQPYQCPNCPVRFKQVKLLKYHIETKHKVSETCTICNKSSTVRNWLEKHMGTHEPPKKKFKCPELTCNVEMIRKTDYDRHMLIHNGERPYACETCDKTFVRPDDLRVHANLHKGIFFYCSHCTLKTHSERSLRQHIKRQHMDEKKPVLRNHVCEHCAKMYITNSALQRHIKSAHMGGDSKEGKKDDMAEEEGEEKEKRGNKGNIIKSLLDPDVFDLLTEESKEDESDTAQCALCQLNFFTLGSFIRHMEFKHDKPITEPYQCIHCQERFMLAKPLKIHIERKHKEVKTCTICSKSSTQKNWLTKHMEIHNRPEDKKFKCPEMYCFYACAKKRDMARHVMIHTGEKPFVCKLCGKSFRREEELVSHTRFHKGEFFYCSLCPHKTTRIRSLRQHIKRQHTDIEKKPVVKNHICDICGHAFPSNSVMRRHITQTHKKDVIYHCKECDYETCYPGSMNYHVKAVHRKIRDHKCHYCDAAFADKKGLTWHERRHTGEKPHQCKYCGKLFKRPDGLRYHTMLHEANYKYKCDICGYSTIRTQMLNRHKERKHPETPRHVCTKCDMSFTSPQAVIAHNKQHKDGVEFVTKKPHQCNQCDYSTDQPKSLRKHLERCHEKDPNYECGYCHKKFFGESQCKLHVRNYHEKYFRTKFNPDFDKDAAKDSEIETAVVPIKMEPSSVAEMLIPLLSADDVATTTEAPTITTTVIVDSNQSSTLNLDSNTVRAATEEENAVAVAVLELFPGGYTPDLPIQVMSSEVIVTAAD